MGSRIRILLLEDNPGDARLMQEYLPRNLPFELDIVHCERLAAAVATIQRQARFDLILCDLFLPDSLGFPTFERIQEVAGETPIVVLSGWEDSDQVTHALTHGARDYVNKANLDGLRLVRLLRETVRRAAVHPAT